MYKAIGVGIGYIASGLVAVVVLRFIMDINIRLLLWQGLWLRW